MPHPPRPHPYIPNANPDTQREMLAVLGVESIDDLYASIPQDLRFSGKMSIPEAIPSERSLKRHVEGVLSRNRSAHDLLCFRGGGCAWHYVPAVCDEINGRSEFLTAYAGEPYEDHGRFQAMFEYASLMGELLEMDVVSIPTFDWNQAAATSIRMAQRATGRSRMLYSELVSTDRLSTITNYCRSSMELVPVASDPETGCVDVDDLALKLGPDTIGFYLENPGYLGVIEDRARQITESVCAAGGLTIVGVDPISLGVLKPPSRYGANIVCGDLQPLGIHMQHGGGQSGFIASDDDERIVREYPSRLFGLTRTSRDGEWGFGDVLYDDRTSFGARENGKEFVGTGTALWAITAGVYLSLMGPDGMKQVGQTIVQNARYAIDRLTEIDGVRLRYAAGSHFKEFVIDVSATGVTVDEINRRLIERDILGGIDLSERFRGHGGCMLMCVTEMHEREDIDRLVEAIEEVTA